MSDNIARALRPPTSKRWKATWLCFGAIAINYIDRVNLSVATPTLMQEFSLSSTQMGALMSAFFWPYMLLMMPVGALTNRFGSKVIMGLACLLWGLSTMGTAMVTGFASFFLIRVLLGATESPGYPAAARAVSVWFPKKERTRATSIFNSGCALGSAVAPPIVVWILATWGWKTSFVVTGGFAVIYAFVWWIFYHEPDRHPTVSKEELAYIRQDEAITETGAVVAVKPIPVLQFFTYKKTILTFLGFFGFSYFWGVFTTWIPAYLVHAKGFDMKTMGYATMLPYLLGVAAMLGSGWIADKLMQQGINLNSVRRGSMAVCLLGAAGMMYLAVIASSQTVTIITLTLSAGLFLAGGASAWSIPNDIAPYGQGGAMAGAMSTVGQLAGLAAPMLTGFIIDTPLGYDGALYVTIGGAVFGAFFYLINDYSKLEPRNN